MDVTDAPAYSQRRAKNPFQKELKDQLRQRRAKGLVSDLPSASEESGPEPDELDDDDALLAGFGTTSSQFQRRTDRPTSAKRRPQQNATDSYPALSETIRPGDASKWMKKKDKGKTDNMPPLKMSPRDARGTDSSPLDSRFGRMSPKDARFGQMSPKDSKYGQLSPKDSKYGQMSPKDSKYGQMSPKDSKYGQMSPKDSRFDASPRDYRFGQTSPKEPQYEGYSRDPRAGDRRGSGDRRKGSLEEEGVNLPKSQSKSLPGIGGLPSPGSKQSPTGMTATDLIFNKPTDNKERGRSPPEDQKNKPWQPPSFRKASPTQDVDNRVPSPAGSRGRRTPSIDTGLEPISETPTPRRRLQSPGRDRHHSKEASPRSDQPIPRPRPKADIFGKAEPRPVDLDDYDDRPRSRDKQRFRSKSPAAEERHAVSGRKTPPGRKTPTGRKTPEDKAGVRPRTPKEEEVKERDKREPSLLDFLMEGDQPKPKPRLREREAGRDRPLRPASHDSSRNGWSHTDSQQFALGSNIPHNHDNQGDQSSVCEELEREPGHEKEREKKRDQKRQRDREGYDEAIDDVADAQLKPIDPDVSKTTKKVPVHRPKPRHSLPGTSTSSQLEITFDNTTSIRDAIYDQWLQDKKVKTTKSLKEENAKKKEEDEKKLKDSEYKKSGAKLAYDAWMQQHRPTKKKEQSNEEKEKEAEKARRKKEAEAEKYFKMWKKAKSEDEKEKNLKNKEMETEKENETEKAKRLREREKKDAVRDWENKKARSISRQETEKAQTKKEQERQARRQKERKEAEARKLYVDWMQKKEETEKKEKQKKKETLSRELSGDYDFRPPWSPPNKAVPFGR